MFGFLPSVPGVDDVRALVNRVDTARHHGIPSGCVLELNLRSVPPETAGLDPLAIVTGGGRATTLRDSVAAIHRAAEDPRVAGLIARVQLAASPVGAVQELREAIAAFSAVKPSLAWAETYPGTLSYYLASAFGEVWMQPSGSVGLVGFASSATFLRDALDKAGIEAQFTARGEYKSAANLFTEGGFTEAHREAVTRMLESLQEQVWQAVAESRDIDSGALDALADRAPLLRDDAVIRSGRPHRFPRRSLCSHCGNGWRGRVSPNRESTEDARAAALPDALRRCAAGHGCPAGALGSRSPSQAHDRRDRHWRAHRRRAWRAAVPAVRHLSAAADTIAAALREVAADDSVSAIVLQGGQPRRLGHRVGDHLARGEKGAANAANRWWRRWARWRPLAATT